MRRRRQTFRKPITWPKWTLGAITIFWWGLLIALILTVEPLRMRDVVFTGLYFPFLLLIFLAVSGTLFWWRKRFWPSVLWAIGVSVFLLLRLYGWGNIINLAIIGLCLAVWEVYWWYIDKLKGREVLPPESLIDSN